MFTEFKCGCIFSHIVGRVRTCQDHKPERADGFGGGMPVGKLKARRQYPAFGFGVNNWHGGK